MPMKLAEIEKREATNAAIIQKLIDDVGNIEADLERLKAEKQKALEAGNVDGLAAAIEKIKQTEFRYEASKEILDRAQDTRPYTDEELIEAANDFIQNDTKKYRDAIQKVDDLSEKLWDALRTACYERNEVLLHWIQIVSRCESYRNNMGTPRVNGYLVMPPAMKPPMDFERAYYDKHSKNRPEWNFMTNISRSFYGLSAWAKGGKHE